MTSAERDWPGVDELRKLEMQDLDRALCDALKRSIDFVEEKGGTLDPESVAAYEYAKEHALTLGCVNYLLLLRLRRRGISLRWVSSPSGRLTRWGRGARSLS